MSVWIQHVGTQRPIEVDEDAAARLTESNLWQRVEAPDETLQAPDVVARTTDVPEERLPSAQERVGVVDTPAAEAPETVQSAQQVPAPKQP